MGILAFVVALTLIVSAVCSLLESTLYSTRIATLEAAVSQGSHTRAAQVMLRMKSDIAIPTSAVLILNTVANTAGATVAGMYAADYFGAEWLPAFSAALTMGILFLSEIIPKTYAAARWKSLWFLIARPLLLLQTILYPAVWITHMVSRLVTGGPTVPTISAGEIRATIQLGGRSGQLNAGELKMLDAVLHFDEVRTREVMVPRAQAKVLDVGEDLSVWIDRVRETKHTRFPLVRGSLDNALGLIHTKDLLGVDGSGEVDTKTITRPIERIPDSLPVSALLRNMQRSQRHLALVVDEFGSVVGLVTLENVLELIVGALQDEFDSEEPDIVTVNDHEFSVAGWVRLNQLNKDIDLELPVGDADTLSGLIVSKLGRIPKKGDRTNFGNTTAEVIEIDGARASRIRLTVDDENAQGSLDDDSA